MHIDDYIYSCSLLSAQIDLAYKSNFKVKRTISIHEVIDCNLPRYLSGIGMSCVENVGFCCYKYGPIRMAGMCRSASRRFFYKSNFIRTRG